jgi:hypothetical protein
MRARLPIKPERIDLKYQLPCREKVATSKMDEREIRLIISYK